MIRSDSGRSALAIVLAFATLTSSITAGVAFAAGPAAAHGDHTAGGGTDGSNEWATESDSFRTETVLSGLDRPTEAVFLPDGRMLVIQQGGEILIDDPSTRGGAETYLDISRIDSLDSERERGLLGIALAPDFEESGEFYVYYSRLDNPDAEEKANAEPENVLAEFTHAENDGGTTSRADPDSREVLWRNDIRAGNNIACCHFGGGLDVGDDGKLYLTTGEEFQGDRAQDLSLPDGKIIRLNRDGSVPQDNPFVGDGNPDTLDEIWAYGLRNPYRVTFADNGNFYIGEVGGNQEPDSQEDIHLGRKGANYGWPNCEGECQNDTYDDPIYTYSHGESGDPDGAAVTVGPVYNADAYPDEYDNVLFYSDYNDGWIKYLTLSDDGTQVQQSYNFDSDAGSVVASTVGPDGSLYTVNYVAGEIRRYVYEGGENTAPSVDSATASPESGAVPLNVSFEASASDPDGDDLNYTWQFDDGTTASGASVSHTYEESGSYDAYVEVTDGTTVVESDTVTVSVGHPPEVTLASPADGSTFRAGESLDMAANATDPEDGRLTGDAVEWSVELDHNEHVHPETTATGDSFAFDVPTGGHPTTGDVGYRVTVTATDSDGLRTTETVEIRPEEVDVTLNTQPGGIPVDVEGSPKSTDGGHTFDTVVGYEHSLSAPQSVCRGGTTYEFAGWSDGDTDRVRSYTVPETDATLTAEYEAVGSCEGIPESGLVGHYEADSGVRTNGSDVTGWVDKSGTGNNLTAAGAPQFDAEGANGAGAIRFDGDGDVLERSGLSGFPAGDEDRTMFVVADYVDNGDKFGGVAYGAANGNAAFGLVVNDTGMLTVQGFGSMNDYPSDTQGVGAGWVTQSVVYEDGQFAHYADGSQIDSGTHQFDTNPRRFTVGGEIAPPPHTEMQVSAVLVYDRALSAEERQQVESYLAEKYDGDGTLTRNEPPELQDVSVTYAGGEKTVDVAANASDPDGEVNASSVRIVDRPANGAVTAGDDGTVTYETTDENATGDSFTVAVSDDDGAESAPANVSLRYRIDESDSSAEDGDTDDGSNDGDDTDNTSDDGDTDGEANASFEVSEPTLSATNVTVDESVTLSAVVTNVGDADGNTTVEFTVENGVVDSRTLAVGAGTNENVTFSHAFEEPGTYEIGVDNQSLELTVSEEDSADEDGDGPVDEDSSGTEDSNTTDDGGSSDDTSAGGDGGDASDTTDGDDSSDTGSSGETGDTDDGGDNGGSAGGGSGGGSSGPSDEREPAFETSNATLSATNVTVNESVNASIVVANAGDADGETTVEFAVDNVTVDSRNLAIEAEDSGTAAFSYAFEEPGTYDLRLDNRSLGDVTVVAAQSNESEGGDGELGTATETTPTASTPDGGDGGSGAETVTATSTETEASTPDGGAESATDAETETETGTPGFGPVLAVLSVLLSAAVFARRRR